MENRAESVFVAALHQFQRWQSVLEKSSFKIFDREFGPFDVGRFILYSSVLPALIWVSISAQRNRGKNRSVEKKDNVSLENSSHDSRRRIEANVSDPGLLKKHSEYLTVTTENCGFTYSKIRVFYRPHPQTAQLPVEPSPLPLLVFIHGLGGCVSQFHPLLIGLVNIAPCLAIDLPGCGLSSFDPTSWDAYKIEALAELINTVILKYLDIKAGQQVVLIGHSLGCSLAASVATKSSTIRPDISSKVLALIGICPRSSPPDIVASQKFKRLLSIPGPIFDIWRRWDRRGGVNSRSVARYMGDQADQQSKVLQLKFNEQSKTPVWRRMAWGTIPQFDKAGKALHGLPGDEVWRGLQLPIFLVSGESDHVTRPEEVEKIARYLGMSGVNDKSQNSTKNGEDQTSDDPSVLERIGSRPPSRRIDSDAEINGMLTSGRRKLLKTVMLPSPASHGLLYMPGFSRILTALISDFLSTHVSERLSLGWQLQYLSTEGKWDVKNLEKWRKVAPVSGIIGGVFRSMKTLREIDDYHRPEIFVQDWGNEIKDVIDISHESPVYDPRGLETRGIKYHKFPTVSKIPPTNEEVDNFSLLVDRIRAKHNVSSSDEAPADIDMSSNEKNRSNNFLIGVHCHYGYNRTGYFVICYLVDRCAYKLQDAINEFERQKPPGIRHPHFINELHVRYCIGLQRRPTLI